MDVEALLVDFLADNLTCAVSSEVPSPRPDQLVTVERTGGGVSYGMDHPLVAVQCWATTRAEAADLAYRVGSVLENLDTLPEVTYASVESIYNYPTEHDEQRYQITLDVICYQ